MAQSKTADPMDTLRQMLDGSGALRERMKTQVEQLAHAQQAMLSEVEEMSRSWFARRQNAAQAALEAAQEICRCGEVGDALQAYQRWLAGSIGRMAADTIEAQTHGARIAQAFAVALRRIDSQPSAAPSTSRESTSTSSVTGIRHARHREAA